MGKLPRSSTVGGDSQALNSRCANGTTRTYLNVRPHTSFDDGHLDKIRDTTNG